jgi:hypothetical protein
VAPRILAIIGLDGRNRFTFNGRITVEWTPDAGGAAPSRRERDRVMQMEIRHIIAAAAVVTPILLLFLAGAFIAARSGVDRVSTGNDVLRIAGNFSAIVLRVAAYVVVLLLVQHFIGLRSTFGW